MAARGHVAPRALEAVLPAGEARLVGPHVLEEEQLPAGPQDARGLAQRSRGIVRSAEHERADHGVEACVLERQVLGRRNDDLCGTAALRDLVAQAPGHVLARLGQHELRDGVGVVLQVRAGPRAELERRAVGLRQHPRAHVGETSVLGALGQPVVQRGEQAAAGCLVDASWHQDDPSLTRHG